MTKTARYLLDVNVLLALTIQDHIHHQTVKNWFYATPMLRWAVCAFTEAGFLRIATAPTPNQLAMSEATAILKQFASHTGYQYQPTIEDWQTLTAPFSRRLYGTKQVTDAYLLGIAIREELVLVTMDKGILHLAGAQYKSHILLLAA